MFLSAARTSAEPLGFAVQPVDDQIAAVVQLVGQTLSSHATDDSAAVVARLEHRQLARLAAHGPLHGADDVAALAQGAQGLFRIGMHGPGGRSAAGAGVAGGVR
ncbi:hypothetical protein G6F21_014264 [Rhizopus arrhizus]|nr:hypothetical protein G6F21_014264 [Rhizopus arrhizus]